MMRTLLLAGIALLALGCGPDDSIDAAISHLQADGFDDVTHIDAEKAGDLLGTPDVRDQVTTHWEVPEHEGPGPAGYVTVQSDETDTEVTITPPDRTDATMVRRGPDVIEVCDRHRDCAASDDPEHRRLLDVAPPAVREVSLRATDEHYLFLRATMVTVGELDLTCVVAIPEIHGRGPSAALTLTADEGRDGNAGLACVDGQGTPAYGGMLYPPGYGGMLLVDRLVDVAGR